MNKHELLQLNRQADAFSQAQVPMMVELIELLKPFGITHFAYNKMVGRDQFMVLCPCYKWFRDLFSYSADSFIVEPQLSSLDRKNQAALWQTMYPSDSSVREAFQYYNINHGITLFRDHINGVSESFHFATTNENEQILDFYLNNMDILSCFVQFFQKKMSDTIDHGIPGKLIRLPTQPVVSSFDSPKMTTEAFTQMLDSLLGNEKSNKKNKLNLTPKQYEVFQLLKLGYSSKQIAFKLEKSHRTVEGYATAILKKFNLMSRRDLIDFPPNLMNKVLPHE